MLKWIICRQNGQHRLNAGMVDYFVTVEHGDTTAIVAYLTQTNFIILYASPNPDDILSVQRRLDMFLANDEVMLDLNTEEVDRVDTWLTPQPAGGSNQ